MPIGWEEVKRPTSAIFSKLVECVYNHMDNIPYCSSTSHFLSAMLLRWTAQILTNLRVRTAAVARSACVTWRAKKATARVQSTVYKNLFMETRVHVLHGHH